MMQSSKWCGPTSSPAFKMDYGDNEDANSKNTFNPDKSKYYIYIYTYICN